MARDAEEELEDNPAMGWRALRLALDRDGLMKAQARALLEAAAGKVLHVMFPMVSEPWEYEQARALVEHQREWLVAQKKKLRSEEHTSELQSLMRISYAVFCLKKKNTTK